jgi:hypothetical protein
LIQVLRQTQRLSGTKNAGCRAELSIYLDHLLSWIDNNNSMFMDFASENWKRNVFVTVYLIFRHAHVDHVGSSNGSPPVQSANSNFTKRMETEAETDFMFSLFVDCWRTEGLSHKYLHWTQARIVLLLFAYQGVCRWRRVGGNGTSQRQSSHIFVISFVISLKVAETPCAATFCRVRCRKLLPSRQHGDGGCWVLLACPEACSSICQVPCFICFILFREYDTDCFEFGSMLSFFVCKNKLYLVCHVDIFPKIYELRYRFIDDFPSSKAPLADFPARHVWIV